MVGTFVWPSYCSTLGLPVVEQILNVAVLGAAGRMGRTVVDAIRHAADLELVAQLDSDDDITALFDMGVDVAVDFTVPAVTETHVHALIDAGIHAVVGTSGWTEDALARVRGHLGAAPHVGVLVAPNFAIGAVLTERFAAAAARWFESVEVIEMHHPDKTDAPSGTAIHTAAAIAVARDAAGLGPIPDLTTHELDGARGAIVDGIHVHAVRSRGLVAHQEVLLGNPGEQLTIRHDSLDRVSFMPGVLLGIRSVGKHPGLTVGLSRYLGL